MNSLTKLQGSVWWGGATELIAISAIVIAFLFEWRTAVISLTAIPLSIIGAVTVLTAASSRDQS